MPVLMNKGDDPRQNSWLFFSTRTELSEWHDAIVGGRFESGTLAVDPDELAGAKKASTQVRVFLDVDTLVPEDIDIEQTFGTLVEKAVEEAAAAAQASAEDGPGDNGADSGADEPVAADDAADGRDEETDGETASASGELPAYEAVPAPEGTRVLVGTTTAQAARTYLQPREVDGKPWTPELPGLQMLAQLIGHMRSSGNGLPANVVWHLDADGILRMSPAKQVKAMAGNILKVKL